MKPKQTLFAFLAFLLLTTISEAQEYKIKQSTGIMGMQSESTVYVKGMRKRTETAAIMGMGTPPVVIEQCDLQRTIKLNDKKKLYYIIPFAKETDEVIDDDVKPAVSKTKPAVTKTTTEKGGTITMWYTITDTGERKQMNGFTARHIWTYQKMKPSADACTMKDSMIIKTDGWYIDLPQFNCPVSYRNNPNPQAPQQKPDCIDKFVTHRKGKGKLGFPLSEKRTMIMGGQTQNSEFVTDLQTLEFSTATLDSMLFTIPPGYKQAANEGELQEKFDMSAYIKNAGNQNNNNQNNNNDNNNSVTNPSPNEKKAGGIRIGVYEPKGEGSIAGPDLQQHLVQDLTAGNIEAIAVANEEEAKAKNCDYSLTTDFLRFKSGSKVGGLIKAIKNTDPNSASSFNIEAELTLKTLADGTTKLQEKVSGKYDGNPENAAKKALDEGAGKVLKGLN